MSHRCELTGKKNNVANSVSHSNRHTKRLQKANVTTKRLYIASQKRWVSLKVSTAALRSIEKVGVEEFLKRTGVTF
ncbi:MAG TPA: 50S ribosomal protein L28 [Candidatus Sumerlaeota bacterium]|mgnify:CR=1 FL=1|nr:50S ribosomal protein L28 [Candidatus Sumerlaeota bacterium]HPS01416.1 50S ribosomal protein L28 [Candidatus Sumerlaeota bacterium]